MAKFRICILSACTLSACGFLGTGDTPTVFAHRAAAGNWPENSRTAVLGSIERAYPGIEVDVVLTAEGVPVLAHDPWLDPERCTTASGERFEERIPIEGLTLDTLEDDYLCGGLPDPENPDAEVVAESLMSLDELLAALAPAPEIALHLDVKYDPEETASAEVFAAEILDRWDAADLSNPLFVESTLPEGIRAFEEAGEVTTYYGWPRFTADTSTTGVALGNELLVGLGLRDGISLAQSAGADGLSVPYQLVDRQSALATREEGLLLNVWTMNEEYQLAAYCDWPEDVIMTDYPERAPCL